MRTGYRAQLLILATIFILAGCLANRPKMSLDYTPTNWLHQESFKVVDTIGNEKYAIALIIVPDQTDTTKYLLESIFESYHNYDLTAPYQPDSHGLVILNYNVIVEGDTLDVHIGENEETTINRSAGDYLVKARRKLTHYQISVIPDSVIVNFDIVIKNNDGTILKQEHKAYTVSPPLLEFDINTPILLPNYPNPFSPTTRVTYNLSRGADVIIEIWNIAGHVMDTLVNDFREAGEHTEPWDGRDLEGDAVASGVYFVRLIVGSETSTMKMVLLK